MHAFIGKVEMKQYETMLNILEKVLRNILKNPTQDKFRSIKKGNKVLAKKFFIHEGMHEVLTSMNFAFDEQEQVYLYYGEEPSELNDYFIVIDGLRVEVEAYYNNLHTDPELVEQRRKKIEEEVARKQSLIDQINKES